MDTTAFLEGWHFLEEDLERHPEKRPTRSANRRRATLEVVLTVLAVRVVDTHTIPSLSMGAWQKRC